MGGGEEGGLLCIYVTIIINQRKTPDSPFVVSLLLRRIFIERCGDKHIEFPSP